MLFIVNDEHNYALLQELSTYKNIRVMYDPIPENISKDEKKIYINVKPPNEDYVCFIDSWGMSEEIPQAHIVPKKDDAQKIQIICDVLQL